MPRLRRTLGKWTLRVVVLLLLVVALYVAFLAYPAPLFAHKQTFGEFTVHSGRPLPDDFARTIEDARERIAAMAHASPGEKCRVFICDTERLYSVFARLTRRAPNSLAIGLSVLGNMYLNEPKIQRFAAAGPGVIRHSRYEGNVAEVIAHEIAHFNMVGKLGYRRAMGLPFWKSEGYAEYQANLASTRDDGTYDFVKRIDLLLDDSFWGYGGSVARTLYEWHVLVEFLGDVKGIGLEGLEDPAITESSTRREMLAWYNQRR
jgi:hypothetical protein